MIGDLVSVALLVLGVSLREVGLLLGDAIPFALLVALRRRAEVGEYADRESGAPEADRDLLLERTHCAAPIRVA